VRKLIDTEQFNPNLKLDAIKYRAEKKIKEEGVERNFMYSPMAIKQSKLDPD
jgi:hypothetical protein